MSAWWSCRKLELGFQHPNGVGPCFLRSDTVFWPLWILAKICHTHTPTHKFLKRTRLISGLLSLAEYCWAVWLWYSWVPLCGLFVNCLLLFLGYTHITVHIWMLEDNFVELVFSLQLNVTSMDFYSDCWANATLPIESSWWFILRDFLYCLM